MIETIKKLSDSIAQLENLLIDKVIDDNSQQQDLIAKLEKENKLLKQEYLHLKETSQEVIKELNSSIQVIDEYFKKQNAHS